MEGIEDLKGSSELNAEQVTPENGENSEQVIFEKLIGKYTCFKQERVDEFLIGVNADTFLRRIVSATDPYLYISQDINGKCTLRHETPILKYRIDFKIGEEIKMDESFDGRSCVTKVTCKNGSLTFDQVVDHGDNVQSTISKTNGTLSLLRTCGENECKELYNKISDEASSPIPRDTSNGAINTKLILEYINMENDEDANTFLQKHEFSLEETRYMQTLLNMTLLLKRKEEEVVYRNTKRVFSTLEPLQTLKRNANLTWNNIFNKYNLDPFVTFEEIKSQDLKEALNEQSKEKLQVELEKICEDASLEVELKKCINAGLLVRKEKKPPLAEINSRGDMIALKKPPEYTGIPTNATFEERKCIYLMGYDFGAKLRNFLTPDKIRISDLLPTFGYIPDHNTVFNGMKNGFYKNCPRKSVQILVFPKMGPEILYKQFMKSKLRPMHTAVLINGRDLFHYSPPMQFEIFDGRKCEFYGLENGCYTTLPDLELMSILNFLSENIYTENAYNLAGLNCIDNSTDLSRIIVDEECKIEEKYTDQFKEYMKLRSQYVKQNPEVSMLISFIFNSSSLHSLF